MGEAKRRRTVDPLYGKSPKYGKGIIVSPMVSINNRGQLALRGGIDPVELRRSVLFFDRLVLPKNRAIELRLTPDESFLVQCGVLEEYRASVPRRSGDMSELYTECHLAAFSELEAREPGLWAMSEGPSSFNLQAGGAIRESRGALVELHRAIPLPERNVPLEDLLRFKEARRDEIKSLTLELDGLFSRVVSAADSAFELQRAISEIDEKCANVIRSGKESKIRFTLSDVAYGISLDIHSTNLLVTGILGSIIGTTIGLPEVGGVIGAAASTLKFNVGLGGKLERSRKAQELALSPYRVVSTLINEPI